MSSYYMQNSNICEIFNRDSADCKPFVVLEMANNHMGDIRHGLRIIREMGDVAKKFPDFLFGFKFQYRDMDTFIHPDYQSRLDLKYVKRFLETRLTEEEFLLMKDEAEKSGFITVCTPFDEKSVERAAAHNYDIIKIGSCSFTDWPLLEKIVRYDKPLIASTGGVKLEDIDKVVSFLKHRNKKFVLMHCVGQYPTLNENLQLNQIDLLQERYPESVIGFSTHEAPDNFEAVKLAVAKGARILEKHVAAKSDKYPVNSYSAMPEQVEKWLAAAQESLIMCGTAGRRHNFSKEELADIRQFQRGAFALSAAEKGERLTEANLFFAFPNAENQILANDISKYTIFTALKDIKEREPIMADNVSKIDTREKVYEIVKKINVFLKQANIPVSAELDFELSHHYGLEKFYECGAAIISCVNREYCKKLIVLLAGQKHPVHFHKRKEETFHVLYGDVSFGVGEILKECRPGDIMTIERGVKHNFSTQNGCVFEEISTTHYKDDSFYEDEEILKNKNRKTELTYWII